MRCRTCRVEGAVETSLRSEHFANKGGSAHPGNRPAIKTQPGLGAQNGLVAAVYRFLAGEPWQICHRKAR